MRSEGGFARRASSWFALGSLGAALFAGGCSGFASYRLYPGPARSESEIAILRTTDTLPRARLVSIRRGSQDPWTTIEGVRPGLLSSDRPQQVEMLPGPCEVLVGFYDLWDTDSRLHGELEVEFAGQAPRLVRLDARAAQVYTIEVSYLDEDGLPTRDRSRSMGEARTWGWRFRVREDPSDPSSPPASQPWIR